ncbi:MAG: cytochrome P450 [Gemmataceae bacterium]
MSATLNPFDPDFISDPYPYYRLLRTHAPVVWVEGLHSWVVSRYDDILRGLRDPRLVVNAGNTTAFRAAGEVAGPLAVMGEMFQRQMLFRDPPEHTRLRGLVSKAFTPKVVQQLQPAMERLVDDLLDRAARRGGMDLIADLAFPLPVTVIAMLLGVPAEDHAKFKAWSGPIAHTVEPVLLPEHLDRAAAATVEILDYFRTLVKRKRANPGDDLLSTMIAAEEQGQRLTTDELLANAVLFLVAGHETTVNLIGNGVLALLRHPEELAKLRADPGKIDNTVEEVLRFDSPVQLLSRFAQQELTIGGQAIPAGQEVLFVLGSGNRDEAAFADPDRLDIDRQDVRPLSFGGGVHYCIGAPLARSEAATAIGKIVRRFPRIELASDHLPRRQSATLRGLQAMPLRF